MQLFVRAQSLHTVELTGSETFAHIKVTQHLFNPSLFCTLNVSAFAQGGQAGDMGEKDGKSRFVNVVPTFGKKKGPNANS